MLSCRMVPLDIEGNIVKMMMCWVSRDGEWYRVLAIDDLVQGEVETLAEGIEATPPENTYLDENADSMRVYWIEIEQD